MASRDPAARLLHVGEVERRATQGDINTSGPHIWARLAHVLAFEMPPLPNGMLPSDNGNCTSPSKLVSTGVVEFHSEAGSATELTEVAKDRATNEVLLLLLFVTIPVKLSNSS